MGGDKCGKWVSGQARTFSVSGKIEMFLSTGSCPVTYTAAHVQDSPPSPCVTITISLVVVLPKSLASCKLQLPNRVEIYSIGQFDFRLGPNLGRCGLRVVSYRGMCSSRRGTFRFGKSAPSSSGVGVSGVCFCFCFTDHQQPWKREGAAII